jgi:hypothetical protein
VIALTILQGYLAQVGDPLLGQAGWENRVESAAEKLCSCLPAVLRLASPFTSITIMENKNNADHKNNALEGVAAYFGGNPTAPARILVSTATHLVPGDGYFAKTEFMQNLISQYHWSRDFEWSSDRFEAYNAEFGYDNRTCYFLIDHGQSPDGNDDVVPILWYRWTGESL